MGFGLVISGGVLEEENLSAHVRLVYVIQLQGLNCHCAISHSRPGGEEDRSLNLDAADSNAAGYTQLALPSAAHANDLLV